MVIPQPPRLALPQVTLIAVTSVNIAATVTALERCMEQVDFGAVKLLSHQRPAGLHDAVEWVQIAPIRSAAAYSQFILADLADHVAMSHALIVQWDGHVVDSRNWQSRFLEYDYIGASWPQFQDGHDVGNGGFSLRSRALLQACRTPGFRPVHPEDVAIGRVNRTWLEAQGFRFAPRDLADVFAAERAGNPMNSFGYHGVWHMPRLLGRDAFWHLYRDLDERSSIRPDFAPILRQIGTGPRGLRRAAHLVHDRIIDRLNRRKAEP